MGHCNCNQRRSLSHAHKFSRSHDSHQLGDAFVLSGALHHHLHHQEKCILAWQAETEAWSRSVISRSAHSFQECLGRIWNTSSNHEDEASYEVHSLTVPHLHMLRSRVLAGSLQEAQKPMANDFCANIFQESDTAPSCLWVYQNLSFSGYAPKSDGFLLPAYCMLHFCASLLSIAVFVSDLLLCDPCLGF